MTFTVSALAAGRLARTFDLIINTVSASLDTDACLTLLRLDGVLVTAGVTAEAISFHGLRLARRTITFTKNGSLRQNQEMLDFCARHGIGAEVETVPADQANSALERLDKGDVRYRFVIDASTFSPSG